MTSKATGDPYTPDADRRALVDPDASNGVCPAERWLATLAESSLILATSLDYTTTLPKLALFLVSTHADCCLVDLVAEHECVWRLAAATNDLTRIGLVERLSGRFPRSSVSANAIHNVLATGKPLALCAAVVPLDAAIAMDERQVALIRELELRSALVLPLTRASQILGTLTLARRSLEHGVEPKFTEMAENLAKRIALAIDNGRLYAEARQTQREIIRVERLNALTQMATAVAHDFNNDLAMITGFSEILLGRPKEITNPERVRSYVQMMQAASQEAFGLIRRLRDFYRPATDEEISTVDIAPLVADIIVSSPALWQAQVNGVPIQVVADVAPSPAIPGHPAELRRVLEEVVANAVEAMPTGGYIELRARHNDGQVVLSIRDTGHGMVESVLDRCIEPFFTNKHGHGAGLGLAFVYGAMKRHRGTLRIDSTPGVGTTVTLTLPDQIAPPLAEIESSPPINGAPKRLTILLVDDAPIVRAVGEAFLNVDGYTVKTATNGIEALAQFRAEPFDLVVTDLVMPGLGGDQLAIAIKRTHPSVPIVLLTDVGEVPGDEAKQAVDLILGKPVTLFGLRDAVVRAIARR